MPETAPVHEITHHATTPEGLVAQGRMIKRFLNGEGTLLSASPSPIENTYNALVQAHAGKAADEINDLLPLQPKTLDAIRSTTPFELVGEEKKTVIDYIFYSKGIPEHRKLLEIHNADAQIAELDSSLDKFHTDASIHFHGPSIEIHPNTPESQAFIGKVFASEEDYGLCVPLPIRKLGQQLLPGEQLHESQNVYILLINDHIPMTDDENVGVHEKWHALDILRNQWLNDARGIGHDSHREHNDLLVWRLEGHFFPAEQYARSIIYFHSKLPFTHHHFLEKNYPALPPTTSESVTSRYTRAITNGFSSIQTELPAYIAGFVLQKDGKVLTDSMEKTIIDTLVELYTPFSSNPDARANQIATKDTTGKWIVDPEKIQGLPNVWMGDLSLPQAVVDFSYNPEGEGYKAREAMKAGIHTSITAYKELAALRGDPYLALAEISLIPISQWEVFVKRKKSEMALSQPHVDNLKSS